MSGPGRRSVLAGLSAVAVLGRRAAAQGVPPAVQHVAMSDGGSIALEVGGSGPSLLMVHGSGTDRHSWAAVTPLLQPHFRTAVMDRRGRNASRDGGAWSFDREVADLIEVAAALPGPVFLLGHSMGAALGLEALARTDRFARAVLYEPPLKLPGGIVDGRTPDDVCAAAAAGDNDRAMTLFFRNYVLLPEPAIAGMRGAPSWPAQAALAPTVCREGSALAHHDFVAARFAHAVTPTLLLLGSESPPGMALGVRAAAAALPHAGVALLPGQQHLATRTAPGLLATDVTRFLLG